ncbi:regulator of chromosome condensation 1/beta-lactamase-inhibitor protein II [Colletotrichum godetiae]|uniref:Regulator of chromosome condensation 1/beta-lactamase-inhibitor protein II n=1 Tax=Colletotrichum godetiae TaxID=1209918 RepID=A0AAJ0EXK3_9PEZI|nr:regulator of chromosome condensation 1/beta-lactamase-inhibitor protein II [Colletotrichum godetiae]KAK1675279.1 regulator of chromosome condensation 1/beta-lactamase-inhibitor protein II [Colletotrichum godetiae]
MLLTVTQNVRAANNRHQAHNNEHRRPERPTQILDVNVWGSGENSELGLGPRVTGAPRPRAQKLLQAYDIVQISAGGMHCAAFTNDGEVLTWGVNDDGALGRVKPSDAPEEGPQDLLDPFESTPGPVRFEDDLDIVQVATTNSACFALTSEGSVYGWGSFAGGDGNFGFLYDKPPQTTERHPVPIPGLNNIVELAGGANHVLALTRDGDVFAWGSGEQNELGRRLLARRRFESLIPQRVGLPRHQTAKIFVGSHHSFAIDVRGKVWAFGLNNFGQCGVPTREDTGFTTIISPTIVKSLKGHSIHHIACGLHHSIACTNEGKVLVWGRCDDGQMGIDLNAVPHEDIIFDARGRPRVLNVPTVVPVPSVDYVAAGIDNCFAVSQGGDVVAWGFSASYNTGLGTTDTVREPTEMRRSGALMFVDAGGQFGISAGPRLR